MTPCNLRPGLLTVGASALFVPAELLGVILSVHCLWFLCGGRMGNRLIPRCLANRPFWPPFNLSGVWGQVSSMKKLFKKEFVN